MAASVVGGISISMPIPAEALNRVHGSYESRYFRVVTQNNKGNNPIMFANAGNEKVWIAGVSRVSSGDNAGYIETNKGKFYFGKRMILNFFDSGFGTVTIERIVIY